MPTKKVVHIKTAPTQAPLSPAQKQFNNLIKKIDTQKKLLAEWQETFSRCQQDAMTKLEPLKKTLQEQQLAMLKLLDQQFTSHKFTANQQDKLSHLITETCEELLQTDGSDQLKTLYNKYSGGDYDTEAQEEQDMAADFLKQMMERELGIKIEDGEFDPNDPEASAERLFTKFKQQQEQAEAASAARPQRKKTAKQLAQEAKDAEEAANVSKSIQAVYRQLTSALHPDREQDPVERERKTELMQQVTVAYGNKDLLKLLELQLAVEQIDQTKLNNIAADRLKHYNKILNDQLRELQEEVFLKEDQIRMMLHLAPFETLSPKRLVMMVREDVRTMQDMITRIQRDLRTFQDVKNLKAWLKSYRIPEPDFDPFFDGFPPFR
ncbi:molecular chaperone DnaJ [Thiothrix fructosivorans]|uniref:Molecular chaperone DnaJ n=1 Tax=Thiothrix fructosivorans TaxID=111770 RepID=A0A8B0SIL1_9GAMM|nr:molecular chaperone DnaJ [Thiothrix fructosivorans]MBO0613380.1 molecular chaperone DnaJ [Thiothrix fructosivorans]QTX11186.1 molecular chaperone DnaJ [Thiothrix fructosivorans]